MSKDGHINFRLSQAERKDIAKFIREFKERQGIEMFEAQAVRTLVQLGLRGWRKTNRVRKK